MFLVWKIGRKLPSRLYIYMLDSRPSEHITPKMSSRLIINQMWKLRYLLVLLEVWRQSTYTTFH